MDETVTVGVIVTVTCERGGHVPCTVTVSVAAFTDAEASRSAAAATPLLRADIVS